MSNEHYLTKFHLVGIKGTGMSALAKVLLDLGYEVTGSDVKESYFTDSDLKERNIVVSVFSKDNIKDGITYISSSCYKEDNVEVKEIKKHGYKFYYFHEFIGDFFKETTVLGISGTHGKTTTSHFLDQLFSDEKKMAIIGDGYGVANSDYKYLILEACEYQNHFLSYHFNTLIINNIDLDHLDYFNNIDEIIDSFQKAANNSKCLVINNDDENCKKIKHDNIITFGLSKDSMVYGEIIEEYSNGYLIDVWIDAMRYRYIIPLPGKFNVYDFLGALSVYYIYKKDLMKVQEKIYNYIQPRRRMQEYKFLDNVVIDDYAHHPSEIKYCLEAIKQKYFGRKLIVIFQPHTYTRTLRLKDKFKNTFDSVDELYLAKTFTSKRESKNKDLEKEVKNIFENSKSFDKKIIKKLKKEHNSVILFVGAGNIDLYIKKLVKPN